MLETKYKQNIYSFLNRKVEIINNTYEEDLENIAEDISQDILNYTNNFNDCITLLNQLSGKIICSQNAKNDVKKQTQRVLAKVFAEEIRHTVENKINSYIE